MLTVLDYQLPIGLKLESFSNGDRFELSESEHLLRQVFNDDTISYAALLSLVKIVLRSATIHQRGEIFSIQLDVDKPFLTAEKLVLARYVNLSKRGRVNIVLNNEVIYTTELLDSFDDNYILNLIGRKMKT